MKIDMYPSAKHKGKFLVVPAGMDIQTWKPPSEFDPDLTQVYPLTNTLDIQASDVGRIAMDPADVIRQVEQKGWALVEATITVEIGPLPSPTP